MMRREARRGQTLIELMTTLAIILILGALAVGSTMWVKPWVMQKLGWVIQAGDPVKLVRDK